MKIELVLEYNCTVYILTFLSPQYYFYKYVHIIFIFKGFLYDKSFLFQNLNNLELKILKDNTILGFIVVILMLICGVVLNYTVFTNK